MMVPTKINRVYRLPNGKTKSMVREVEMDRRTGFATVRFHNNRRTTTIRPSELIFKIGQEETLHRLIPTDETMINVMSNCRIQYDIPREPTQEDQTHIKCIKFVENTLIFEFDDRDNWIVEPTGVEV